MAHRVRHDGTRRPTTGLGVIALQNCQPMSDPLEFVGTSTKSDENVRSRTQTPFSPSLLRFMFLRFLPLPRLLCLLRLSCSLGWCPRLQVARLQRENERLKNIVTSRCPGSSGEILASCAASKTPSMVADCARQATALLDQSGFLLVKALQSSQPSFCVTDPQMPDNPIVYASDSFIELTGYDRAQVLGRNCRFLQGPDTDPDAVAKIRKGIEEVRGPRDSLSRGIFMLDPFVGV